MDNETVSPVVEVAEPVAPPVAPEVAEAKFEDVIDPVTGDFNVDTYIKASLAAAMTPDAAIKDIDPGNDDQRRAPLPFFQREHIGHEESGDHGPEKRKGHRIEHTGCPNLLEIRQHGQSPKERKK